jgi:class 3 adenylate cyclase
VAGTVGISVLFTDLVDSTALSSGLGATKAEELRRAHFTLLRAPVAKHGGREVKNLGDGIMAVFPSAGAALDAAVMMQQGVDRHNRSGAAATLRIRIGVAAGDCIDEDDDYFGEPVIQAARLCASADGGQILAAAVLGALAPRGRHELKPVRALELKGLPDALPAVEVVWHPVHAAAVTQIPLQDRLSVSTPTKYIGRAPERALLANAWNAALHGRRRLVLISGEAGQGKTRLVTELAHDAFTSGALVLYGRCDEEPTGAYRPWVEALGHWIEHATAADLASHELRNLGELARVLPALRQRLLSSAVGVPAEGEQFVFFAAVTALIESLAGARPVVIVLDDLHWADRATLQLLRHLVTMLPVADLLVLATYRDTDVDVDHPLAEVLSVMHREDGVDRVALTGLSDQEVIALLEATAGYAMHDSGAPLAHSIRVETAGNPFFLNEIVRHLTESGAIAVDADGRLAVKGELADVGLPRSVREVVGARVRRLGEPVHRLLGAAAVVGREFDVAVVSGITGHDEDAVLDLLEPAMAAGLVAEVTGMTDRFSFTHALVQSTLYTELQSGRRARQHLRVAEVIEAQSGRAIETRAGELAHHWSLAPQPAASDKAVEYALRAGDQALAELAPDEAVRWYLRALDLIGDRDAHVRCDALVRLGDAERQAGDPLHRDHLLQAAELADRLGDHRLLCRAALANNRGLHSASGEVDHDRVSVLERALRVDDVAESERALLLATLAGELAYSGDERRFELALQAVETARRCDDRVVLLDTILRAVNGLKVPEFRRELRRLNQEAIALTDGSDDLIRRYFAVYNQVNDHVRSGDMAAARGGDTERQEIAEGLGLPVLRWMAAYQRAQLTLLEGDAAGAELLATEAFKLGLDCGQPDAVMFYGSQLMGIRWHQGRNAEMVPLISQTAEENPGLPVFRVVLAGFHAWAGDDELSRALFERLAADGFAFPHDDEWLLATCLAAETASRLDDRASVKVLFDRLTPFSDQVAATGVACLGAVAHYLGCLATSLGRWGEGEAYFNDALARHESLEAPFLCARTLLEMAGLARERDEAQARALYDKVVALSDEYEMVEMRERALRARS